MVKDQAVNLRRQMRQLNNRQSSTSTKVITVTSGKGGVGKSNFTINFALTLIDRGYKVAVIDNDIGFGNIDVLLGIVPRYNLLDMLEKNLDIFQIIEEGPNGLKFIAGGSELDNIFTVNDDIDYIMEQLSLLYGEVDFLLIDTGAGIKEESLKVLLASDEVILITVPEPTSITDSYAMIKLLHKNKKDINVNLVINQITDLKEGDDTANKLKVVSKRFLSLDMNLLGFIHKDDSVSKAVKKQIPFSLSFPNSKASKNIKNLVEVYLNVNTKIRSEDVTTFFEKFRNFF